MNCMQVMSFGLKRYFKLSDIRTSKFSTKTGQNFQVEIVSSFFCIHFLVILLLCNVRTNVDLGGGGGTGTEPMGVGRGGGAGTALEMGGDCGTELGIVLDIDDVAKFGSVNGLDTLLGFPV